MTQPDVRDLGLRAAVHRPRARGLLPAAVAGWLYCNLNLTMSVFDCRRSIKARDDAAAQQQFTGCAQEGGLVGSTKRSGRHCRRGRRGSRDGHEAGVSPELCQHLFISKCWHGHVECGCRLAG